MRTIAFFTFLACSSAFAGDSPAKTIAPFVDEQTFLVTRLDAGKIKLEAILQWISVLQPAPAEVAALARAWQDALKNAGVKEAYAGISLSDPLGQFFIVMPAAADAKVDALDAVLPMLPVPMTRERFKDVLLVGSPAVVKRLREQNVAPNPLLAEAFAAVDGFAAQTVVLVPPLLRQSFRELMPRLPDSLGSPPAEILDDGFRWGAIGINSPPAAAVRFVIQARDASAAKAMAQLVNRAIDVVAKHHEVKLALPNAEDALRLLSPSVSGAQLVAELKQEELSRVLTSAMDKLRQARGRNQSMNNLKQLGLAMHGYHDVNKTFPPPANRDKTGKPLLSWRVHILPYLNEAALHQEFRLDEPWDSAHNMKLIARMPAVFRSPLHKKPKPGMTTYVVPTGKGTIFDDPKGVRMADITDGVSRTVLLFDANDDSAVVWTKPQDIDAAGADLPARLVRREVNGFLAAYADGSAHVISQAIRRESLDALIGRSDGRVVNDE